MMGVEVHSAELDFLFRWKGLPLQSATERQNRRKVELILEFRRKELQSGGL